MKVTLSPCAPDQVRRPSTLKSPLFDLAQTIYDDCKQDVVVEVLDSHGNREAVFGAIDDDAIMLF
jgi:hypothetical protein